MIPIASVNCHPTSTRQFLPCDLASGFHLSSAIHKRFCELVVETLSLTQKYGCNCMGVVFYFLIFLLHIKFFLFFFSCPWCYAKPRISQIVVLSPTLSLLVLFRQSRVQSSLNFTLISWGTFHIVSHNSLLPLQLMLLIISHCFFFLQISSTK